MRVLKNSAFYVAAGLLPNLVNLLLLPLYTRHLLPEDYGLVSLVTTLMSFLGTVAGLQIANCTVRLYFDHSGEDVKTFVSTLFWSLLGINLVLFLVFHFNGPALSRWLFPQVDLAYFPLILLGLTGLFFQTILNFFYGLFRVREKGGAFFAASLSFMLVGAALGIYFVVIRGMGPRGVLLAGTSNFILHACVLTFCFRSFLRFRFCPSIFFAALRFSLPLIFHAMGLVLFMYTDKYILSFHVPVAAIGLYDLAGRLTNVMRMVVTSYHGAVMPDFMRMSKEDKSATTVRYAGVMTRFMVVLAAMFLGLSLFSRELIMILAPPSYHEAHVLVPILAAGFVLRGLQGFPISALMFEKKTRVIPLITLGAGLLNLGLNLVFIPRFGVAAAAWTTLAAYAFAFTTAVIFSRVRYPLVYEWRGLAMIVGFACILWKVGQWVSGEGIWESLAVKVVVYAVFCAGMGILNPGGIVDEIKSLLASQGPFRRRSH